MKQQPCISIWHIHEIFELDQQINNVMSDKMYMCIGINNYILYYSAYL